ncbi:MAG: HdeA/HdeB family chaperone [Methylococcales bacterium]|nr:HdeA/HdeB family chaperone [Methylococcales bacterium]
MNTRHITIGITAAVMLAGSALVFAADAPKADTVKKPLGKLTCEDFIGIDDVIKPQYVIAAVAYTKGGKAKNAVIEVVDTDTLVPFLVEECQKAPKESFWAKLKSKLKL